MNEQHTRLLEEIVAQLRSPQKQIPWEKVLWDLKEVAAYLKVSYRTVITKYAPHPGFPQPAQPVGGQHLYYAHEIADWVEATRSRKPRTTRNH